MRKYAACRPLGLLLQQPMQIGQQRGYDHLGCQSEQSQIHTDDFQITVWSVSSKGQICATEQIGLQSEQGISHVVLFPLVSSHDMTDWVS